MNNANNNHLTVEEETRIILKRRRRVHIILSTLVLFIMVRQFFMENYNNVFTCLLTLLLFMIPSFVDRKLNVRLPFVLELVIMFFIFAAEIMGEIQSFYTIFPYWDSILHATNGFIMAAIGFSMIDILNQDPRFHIHLSPIFVAFVAFCFSVTIGVVWEFFEYGMDRIFMTDMQKDYLVNSISSVKINPSGLNDPILIKDITKTVISGTIDGVQQDWVIENAYLELGIIDTIKDMLVNCIGAIIFSIIGMIYIKNRGKGKFASSFIPTLKTEEEIEATEEVIKSYKKDFTNNKKNKQSKNLE